MADTRLNLVREWKRKREHKHLESKAWIFMDEQFKTKGMRKSNTMDAVSNGRVSYNWDDFFLQSTCQQQTLISEVMHWHQKQDTQIAQISWPPPQKGGGETSKLQITANLFCCNRHEISCWEVNKLSKTLPPFLYRSRCYIEIACLKFTSQTLAIREMHKYNLSPHLHHI